MYQHEIYEEAKRRIDDRRKHARLTQEQHIDEIRARFPEVTEIEQQLQRTCLSILQISRDTSAEMRKHRLMELQKRSQTADQMLRDVLTANGYPADYLDIHYHCAACSDSGFHNGVPCTCLTQEIARVGAEHLNASAMLPLCSFETFSLEYYRDLPANQFAAMQRIFQQCRTYAQTFKPNAQSLFLSGKTGLGKTHLSLSIANVVLQKGYSVIYDSAGALIRKIEQEHFGKAQDSNADTMGLLLSCDLLIVDDFGTEFDTQFSRSAIYHLFNGRLSAGKPTIINTNLTHAEIQQRYGDRIVSRLFSCCTGMAFFGSDIRLQKRKEAF